MEVKRRMGTRAERSWTLAFLLLPFVPLGAWWAPRLAEPCWAPRLVLPADDVSGALARRREERARVPDNEFERARRVAYAQACRSELDPSTAPTSGSNVAPERLLAELVRVHGEDVVRSVRAVDEQRAIDALSGRLPQGERAQALGAFAESLERWSALSERRIIAGELVVRVLFDARWNLMHGLDPTFGFDRFEQRAYYGWVAFHGPENEGELRSLAVRAYVEAGFEDADLALAWLAFIDNDARSAARAYTNAYRRTGSMRFRNHALFAESAAAL